MSAYQWHRTGIDVPVLGEKIHPAYGVFAPTRQEYLDLVAEAPFWEGVGEPVVVDIGTGTGVLAVLMARRGARAVVATDVNPRAVACAADNVRRLGVAGRVRVVEADLWPAEPVRADVVVCNPPWIPGRPTSALEQGIYDPRSDVLHRLSSTFSGLSRRTSADSAVDSGDEGLDPASIQFRRVAGFTPSRDPTWVPVFLVRSEPSDRSRQVQSLSSRTFTCSLGRYAAS